eukprot:TRINITY_DN169_c0_g1_i1.p1 TRINITY_DN169_c0_g1~~TRINITY_DN169_c0_g1_i1.p1  ORF type:complete len:932 (-),score=328.23 TRINITY_DN169_c0_g1_i1:3-2798(-)
MLVEVVLICRLSSEIRRINVEDMKNVFSTFKSDSNLVRTDFHFKIEGKTKKGYRRVAQFHVFADFSEGKFRIYQEDFDHPPPLVEKVSTNKFLNFGKLDGLDLVLKRNTSSEDIVQKEKQIQKGKAIKKLKQLPVFQQVQGNINDLEKRNVFLKRKHSYFDDDDDDDDTIVTVKKNEDNGSIDEFESNASDSLQDLTFEEFDNNQSLFVDSLLDNGSYPETKGIVDGSFGSNDEIGCDQEDCENSNVEDDVDLLMKEHLVEKEDCSFVIRNEDEDDFYHPNSKFKIEKKINRRIGTFEDLTTDHSLTDYSVVDDNDDLIVDPKDRVSFQHETVANRSTLVNLSDSFFEEEYPDNDCNSAFLTEKAVVFETVHDSSQNLEVQIENIRCENDDLLLDSEHLWTRSPFSPKDIETESSFNESIDLSSPKPPKSPKSPKSTFTTFIINNTADEASELIPDVVDAHLDEEDVNVEVDHDDNELLNPSFVTNSSLFSEDNGEIVDIHAVKDTNEVNNSNFTESIKEKMRKAEDEEKELIISVDKNHAISLKPRMMDEPIFDTDSVEISKVCFDSDVKKKKKTIKNKSIVLNKKEKFDDPNHMNLNHSNDANEKENKKISSKKPNTAVSKTENFESLKSPVQKDSENLFDRTKQLMTHTLTMKPFTDDKFVPNTLHQRNRLFRIKSKEELPTFAGFDDMKDTFRENDDFSTDVVNFNLKDRDIKHKNLPEEENNNLIASISKQRSNSNANTNNKSFVIESTGKTNTIDHIAKLPFNSGLKSANFTRLTQQLDDFEKMENDYRNRLVDLQKNIYRPAEDSFLIPSLSKAFISINEEFTKAKLEESCNREREHAKNEAAKFESTLSHSDFLLSKTVLTEPKSMVESVKKHLLEMENRELEEFKLSISVQNVLEDSITNFLDSSNFSNESDLFTPLDCPPW